MLMYLQLPFIVPPLLDHLEEFLGEHAITEEVVSWLVQYVNDSSHLKSECKASYATPHIQVLLLGRTTLHN